MGENNNIITNSGNTKKDNDTRRIITVLIMLLTLMIGTTGATYAYFAINASIGNAVSGTAATASLIITNQPNSTSGNTPSLLAPTVTSYKTKPMVPQISYTGTTNVLQKAFNGKLDRCVDGNGNVVCKAYTFYVRNLSTATIDVRGSITFGWAGVSTFTNLRWKLMEDATAVNVTTSTASTSFSATAPVEASLTKTYFDTTNVELTANGGTKQYCLIVWIEETGANQSTSDNGSWFASIEFEAFDEMNNAIGGVTSTITS